MPRVARLLAARLVLAAAVLAVAPSVLGSPGEDASALERGVYGTVACAFAVTALSALFYRRVRRPRAFAALQAGLDVGLVTALVYFSGVGDSIFSFLYVPITVCGAVLLGRPGAYGATALSAAAYGALLFAPGFGGVGGTGSAAAAPPIALGLWGVHTGALLLVALLSSVLSRELHRTGQVLDQRTRDLRTLQSLHERTVESLTSGLLTTDRDGRITSFNPEAERITGALESTVLGRSLDAVLPGVRQLVLANTDPPTSSDRGRVRLPFRDGRGVERHLGVAGSLLRSADGPATGHVVIFQDVTGVVEMERELRRRERLAAAGRLAADLAHEIRNPLAAISGSIQMLQAQSSQANADQEARRLMEIVLRETDRLNRLISDFLQYARSAPPRPERVALAQVLDEVLKVFEAVRPASVHISRDVPTALAIRVDAGQLRQLLWNLFRNAVEAMPEGGELSVRVCERSPQARVWGDRNQTAGDSNWVEIAVTDAGTGIPGEVLDRIFDPFFTTKAKGSGLGLATVHRIVESNEGQLEVESTQGRGTTFRVRFARAEAVS